MIAVGIDVWPEIIACPSQFIGKFLRAFRSLTLFCVKD